MKKKAIIAVSALALMLCFSIVGTLAWLKTKTTPVVNTFTYGDINITLTEEAGKDSDYEFKMIPGNDITKDPKVTVEKDSEACWLFVKVEKSANYSTYLNDYAVAADWTELTDENGDNVEGVYYRDVAATTTDVSFYVLAGKEGYQNGYVTVNDAVTKAQMESIKESGQPTLTFTAYAVQKDNVASAAAAWEIAIGNI